MKLVYPCVRQDSTAKDVHFGREIADPYRWLEDPDSTETADFVAAQNSVTEQFLSACKCKEHIRTKLKQMWDFERYTCPVRYGERYYYWYNTGLQNQNVMYQLSSLDGEPSVFLDPNLFDADGLTAVMGYNFSDQGQYLCYGASYGGSDWFELKFRRCDTGKDLDDVLKQVKFSSIEWTHDEKGVFYCMFLEHQGKSDGTETASNLNQKLMYHRLGTPQSDDVLCVECPDHPRWIIGAEVSQCGRYLLVSFHEGCEPDNHLYYCDLAAMDYVIDGKLKLCPIVDHFEAAYHYVTNIDQVLVLQTNLDAPMYKLITVDLMNSGRECWRDLIRHDERTLLEFALCVNQDRLIVSRLEDVKSCISVHKLQTGEKLTDIALPPGNVRTITGRKQHSLMFVNFTSFLTPGTVFMYDFSQDHPELQVFRESRIPSVDLSCFEAKQVFYESKDKTKIPMFIVQPKAMVRTGDRPCELYGYGGFDISIKPSFSVSRLLMLLHFGGIVAVANIRGGGEYGKRWHDAGRREMKQNTFDDFHAAAEFLIRERYTSPAKLFCHGGSNGGLLVCASCNQRPDLFGAAIAQVPVCDLLRFHKFTIGHAWVSDFGNPDLEQDFNVIIRYSPLHNVPSSAQYPALMVLTADHDDRVVPLHSFKFISTAQREMCHSGDTADKKPILARIDIKAGHGGGKPTTKLIDELVDIYAFLQLTLDLTWKD